MLLNRQGTYRLIVFAIYTAIYNISLAQEILQKGYFRDPLDLPIHLAGNYGELRPDHFHMGLDLKTNGRIGFPVYAAADGYISHVKIEPFGFGNAIYISHPNGYTTVYVHLDNFFPALQEYVSKEQYRLEKWSVFLDIPPGLFPVKQGQFIAHSGNTGGSMAPHLHFEIRDTKTDENRNPMLFGLPITDNTPPTLSRLGVYDGNESSYLQTPHLYALSGRPGVYTIPGGVSIPSDKVRLGIQAVDHQTGSANALGIYSASVSMDGQPVTGFTLDGFGYDQTRYVNAHVDYSLKTGGGPFVEYLSPLPGNLLDIYHTPQGTDGLLHLDDDRLHTIVIEVKDGLGNASTLKFFIRKAGLPPLYDEGSLFLPGQVNVFENDEFLEYLPEHCLYDEVRPVFGKKEMAAPRGSTAASPVYSLISALIPSQDSFTVSIKPAFAPPGPDMADHYVMLQRGAGREHVAKVRWEKGWATVKMRDFGLFQLVDDQEPPVVTPLDFKDGARLSSKSSISVSVRDNLDATRDFRAELDGQWLMFSQRSNIFTYHFDDHFPPGDHILTVAISDEAGNVTRKTYHLNR